MGQNYLTVLKLISVMKVNHFYERGPSCRKVVDQFHSQRPAMWKGFLCIMTHNHEYGKGSKGILSSWSIFVAHHIICCHENPISLTLIIFTPYHPAATGSKRKGIHTQKPQKWGKFGWQHFQMDVSEWNSAWKSALVYNGLTLNSLQSTAWTN